MSKRNIIDAAIEYLEVCDSVTTPIYCLRRGEDNETLETGRELTEDEELVKATALDYLRSQFMEGQRQTQKRATMDEKSEVKLRNED